MEKKLWSIEHEMDDDSGHGDAIQTRYCVAIVEATKEEIDAFLEEWDRPRIYDRPYDNLMEHHITATPIEIVKDLSKVEPYDPMTKYWPDIPNVHGVDFIFNEGTQTWIYKTFDYTTGNMVTKTLKIEEDN